MSGLDQRPYSRREPREHLTVHRHSLRWMELTPNEQAALSRAILDAAFVGSGVTVRTEMPQA